MISLAFKLLPLTSKQWENPVKQKEIPDPLKDNEVNFLEWEDNFLCQRLDHLDRISELHYLTFNLMEESIQRSIWQRFSEY